MPCWMQNSTSRWLHGCVSSLNNRRQWKRHLYNPMHGAQGYMWIAHTYNIEISQFGPRPPTSSVSRWKRNIKCDYLWHGTIWTQSRGVRSLEGQNATKNDNFYWFSSSSSSLFLSTRPALSQNRIRPEKIFSLMWGNWCRRRRTTMTERCWILKRHVCRSAAMMIAVSEGSNPLACLL